ncbi:MAG: serine/threonine-protein kinase [Holophagales bacterium]|nr:serine/threonine-protein kinase [Holophagales bacterium]
MSGEHRHPSPDGPPSAELTEILADAMELDGEARAAYLDQACGEDRSLRAEVDSLLARQEATGWRDFLHRPIAEQLGESLASEDIRDAPVRIGPYRILDTLGEGGMGTVYLGEQDEPVRRKVALKVIRILHHSRLRKRFAAECQVLARLNHPNIAIMYEVGATDEGLPYVALEWIDGKPITEWCDEAGAGIDERLRLFRSACSGIRHAHEKGVLHCDLKPSNVLATRGDGQDTAKIIDFGIARALVEPPAGQTESTEAMVLGTPPYMSPEAMSAAGRSSLDTRTDVFSLGLLLYELLTGVLPFDVEGKGAFTVLHERDTTLPVTPSRRLRELPEDRSRPILELRRTSMRRALRRLSGDLDAIVMKAIAHDPADRYGTPAELAADIERHLTHRPVEARAPTTLYLIRRFARRRSGAVLAGTLLLAALAWGLAARTVEVRRANAEAARANAEAARAAQALEESEQVRRFILDLFEGADPERTAGQTLSVEELLERGAEGLREALPEQPLVRARLLQTVGSIFVELGRSRRASELLEEALDIRRIHLPANHPDVVESLSALGVIYRRLQELDRSESLLVSVLEARLADPEVDPELLAQAHNHLGNLYWQQERFEEAEAAHRRALDLRRGLAREKKRGIERANEAESANNLGVLLQSTRREAEARPHLERAIELFRRELGERHPRLAGALNNLGIVDRSLDSWLEAEERFREAVEIWEAAYGVDHFRPLLARRNLVNELMLRHRWGEAIDEAQRIFLTAERLADHGQRIQALRLKGTAERRAGRYPEAVRSYRRAREIAETELGPSHPQTLRSRSSLATGLAHVGRTTEALELLEEIARAQDRTLEALHPSRLRTENAFGYVYRSSGRFTEAELHYRRDLEGHTERLGEHHPRVAVAAHGLGQCLAGQGRDEEATALFERALEIRRHRFGDAHPSVGDSAHELALIEKRLGGLDRARELFELAVAVRRSAYPPDDPDLAASLDVLAELARIVREPRPERP